LRRTIKAILFHDDKKHYSACCIDKIFCSDTKSEKEIYVHIKAVRIMY